jgi:hypothetical protein
MFGNQQTLKGSVTKPKNYYYVRFTFLDDQNLFYYVLSFYLYVYTTIEVVNTKSPEGMNEHIKKDTHPKI